MRKIIPALLVVLSATPASSSTAKYVLRYDGGSAIHVEASLPPGDGRLSIAQGGGIDQLPDQWTTFTKQLHVRDSKGAVLTTPAGKEGWTTASHEALEVTYDVDLEYARTKWPAGNEQSGRLFQGRDGKVRALYSVTRPLFLFTSTVTDAELTFSLPAGWRAATPWEGSGAMKFHSETLVSLTVNSFMLGEFPSSEIDVGGFRAVVATPDETRIPPLLPEVLKRAGADAARIFPGTPRGRYLLTFFHADEEDGESFESSAALTSPDQFDSAAMVVTGNTVVHELLHHWFGGMMAPKEHDSLAWFTEGFTEYYANTILARSGTVPRSLMRSKMTNVLAGYGYFFESALFRGVTIEEASKKKGTYRFGVYNGGWAIALTLDTTIRSETGGVRSLDDAVRTLFERRGLSRQPVTESDIRSAVNEAAGRDLTPFFDQYLHKRTELPIRETLGKMGLDLRGQPYAADVFLVDAPSPTEQQRALRRALWGDL